MEENKLKCREPKNKMHIGSSWRSHHKNYLGYNSVSEASLMEIWTDLLLDSLRSVTPSLSSRSNGSSGSMLLCIKNAGSEGTVRVSEKLVSMRTTEAMVGLSAIFSWTHSSAIWMHLIISRIEPELSLNVGSMRFEVVPSLQLFQACIVKNFLLGGAKINIENKNKVRFWKWQTSMTY